jgi:hypothetical protein
MSQQANPSGTAGKLSATQVSPAKDKTCASCANLFKTDTSPNSNRCGADYFDKPLLDRKIKRMDAYPLKQLSDSCERHKQQVEGLCSPYLRP